MCNDDDDDDDQVSGIRYQVSYLDWGTFSHRLFLQAPMMMMMMVMMMIIIIIMIILPVTRTRRIHCI